MWLIHVYYVRDLTEQSPTLPTCVCGFFKPFVSKLACIIVENLHTSLISSSIINKTSIT